MNTAKKLIASFAGVSVLAFGLGGCSWEDPDATSSSDKVYDVSAISADAELQKLLPSQIKSSGILKIATSADYEPAEYLSADGKTALGFDMDIIRAVSAKLGLKPEITNVPFEAIIPAIGTKYDVSISQFSITDERMEQVNMTSYVKTGSLFLVNKDSASAVDPTKDACGLKLGVQTNTVQQEWAEAAAKDCAAAGKAALTVLPETDAQMLATKLAGGQLDVIFTDSTNAEFTAGKNQGKFTAVGGMQMFTDAGILTAKDNPQLAEAITKATQAVVADGTVAKILESWNIDKSSNIPNPTLNPKTK